MILKEICASSGKRNEAFVRFQSLLARWCIFFFSWEISIVEMIVVQSRSSTVQIVNFYCPKLGSVGSVLNCVLVALVQV